MEKAVIKGGNSVFENANGIGTNIENIIRFVGYHVEVRRSGLATATIQVASGAVPDGKEYCEEQGINYKAKEPAQIARYGTGRQAVKWQTAAEEYEMAATQILATHTELDDQAEGTKIVEEIERDASEKDPEVIPVINENEAAGGEELKVNEQEEKIKEQLEENEESPGADNDWLAAHIAIATWSKYLFLLSDIDGFLDNEGVKKKITVDEIESLLENNNHVPEKQKANWSGGIESKMNAAAKAAKHDKNRIVIVGNAKFSPVQMILGNCVCTRVVQ